MKVCVIYGNCQGQIISEILKLYPKFCKEYKIYHLYNILLINEKKDLMKACPLHQTNLFIYQPIRDEHGIYSTNHIINNILPKDCKLISFPYIYNNALHVLANKTNNNNVFPNRTIEYEEIYGAYIIHQLLDQGLTQNQIIEKFLNLEIDFDLENRFQKSIDILRTREQYTDIKISQFILDNYKDIKLFIKANHPTVPIYVECIQQLFRLLDREIPTDREITNLYYRYHSKIKQMPRKIGLNNGTISKYPMSPYVINHYQFKWKSEADPDWSRYYPELIKRIVQQYNQTQQL